MRGIGRPRLFVSYARTDAALAQIVKDALEKEGFEAFVDTEQMLVGESFVRRLVGELRKVDGVVAILTPSSVASPWCQAELHHAHALGRTILPIRVGLGDARQVEPLEILQRELHYVEARDASGLGDVAERLQEQLDGVAKRQRRRVITRAFAALVALALVVAGALFAADRLGDLRTAWDRDALLRRLAAADQPLGRAELDRAAKRFVDDQPLLDASLRMARDTTLPDALRLNALLLSSRLLAPRRDPKRWVIEGLDWRDGSLENAKLVDLNFTSGRIEDVTFSRSTFAGVVWGNAPAEGRRGFELADVVFDDCDLLFGWFSGTKLSSVRFVNSSFRGSELDVTSWSLVTIASQSAVPEGSNVITNEVSVVENSVILNRNKPPEAHVLDLGDPKDEVHFRGVVFVATHFRGWIRAEWFEGCTFDRCIFPTGLMEDALTAGGNRVVDATWKNESIN